MGSILKGSANNDELIVNTNTTEVIAGDGFDTVVFSGNYADYTFIPAYSSLKSYDSSGNTVGLYGVERLQFDDGIVDLSRTGDGEIQVNTATSGHQFSPDVAAFSDGGFIVVWASENSDGYSVNAQLFDANGNPSGDEFSVSGNLTAMATPSVAVSSEDAYVISDGFSAYIYDSDSEMTDTILGLDFVKAYTGDGFVAIHQRYTWGDVQDGVIEIIINSSIQSYDYIGNGNYIYFDTGYEHLNAKVFYGDLGFSSKVNTTDALLPNNPVAAELEDEGFVVVWQSRNLEGTISASIDGVDITLGLEGQDPSGYGIYAQRYDYEGNTVGAQFLINTYSDNDQTHPAVTGLNDGGFVVIWESYGQDGSLSGVYGQRYNVDGNVEGDEFKVSDYFSSHQDDPSVTALANGGFIVSWESFGQDGSGDGIFAKVYDANGNGLPTISLGEINDTAPILASFTMLNSVNENTATINETPLFFDAEIVSAAQASNAIYGENLSINSSEKLIKLTLNADIDKLNDASIKSIAAAGLDIGLDWSQFEIINYVDSSTQWFDSVSQTSNFFEVRQNITTGQLESVVVSSLDISSTPSLTLVDNITTDGTGEIDHPSILKVGEVYLNPIDGLDAVSITYGGGVVTNQGAGQFVQATKSIEVNTSPIDAIISTDNNSVLANTNIEAYKGGIDQSISTEVNKSGGVWFHQSVDISEVKLSDADVYSFYTSINISDAIDILRHIVDIKTLTPGSASYHAADVNNDGNINISDAIDVLRHIVNIKPIDTFDLLDTNGDRVTQFNANVSADAPTWTIVANGDVNMSGSFNEAYVAQVDIA